MQFKLIFVILNLLSTLAFAEETNLYQVNYLTQSNDSLHSLQKEPDTKIYKSTNNKDQDNNTMLEDGYDLMGVSSFQGPFVEPNQALVHAQSIRADVVYVYPRKMNEMTRTERLRQIHAEMKKSSKSEKNSVIEVSEADLQDKNSKFEFYATYWAKLPQPIFGVHVIKLVTTNSDTKEKKEEPGLKVRAVIKDSPAFKAGIEKGDIILKLNDLNVDSIEDYSKAVQKNQGTKVKVTLIRDDKEKITTAEFYRR
ncbi:MAG: PDZ domain-containing protein [Candidatus Methylopumilus sp.]